MSLKNLNLELKTFLKTSAKPTIQILYDVSFSTDSKKEMNFFNTRRRGELELDKYIKTKSFFVFFKKFTLRNQATSQKFFKKF